MLKVNWNLRSVHSDYDKLSASVWIRCMQLLPYLREKGIVSTINEPGGDAAIEVFVRNQNKGAWKLAKKLKKQGKYIVFDLVVNYFDLAPDAEQGGAGSYLHNVEECRRMVELADMVMCASEFIRSRASQHHSNTFYIPDSIDRFHFRFRKRSTDFHGDTLKAVWSGVWMKTTELAELYPLLRMRGIDLIIISDKRPDLPGPYTFIPWSYHTFPHAILEGDICLAPRRLDNPYNKGHSHFKIGVFMAQGVPALGSPLMSYQEVLGKVDTDMLCDSLDEWEQALDRILEDRALLQTWSKKSYEAMDEFTTGKVAERYLDHFNTALTY